MDTPEEYQCHSHADGPSDVISAHLYLLIRPDPHLSGDAVKPHYLESKPAPANSTATNEIIWLVARKREYTSDGSNDARRPYRGSSSGCLRYVRANQIFVFENNV